MKHLTSIEKTTVAIGVVAVAVGIYVIVQPYESVVNHPGPRPRSWMAANPPEVVSKSKSRIYGCVAVVMGAGVCALAFYRGKKS